MTSPNRQTPTPRRSGAKGRLDPRLGGAAIACVALPCCAALARAQTCERVESRTTLPAFAGERVRRVDIETESPLDSGLASHFSWLHVRTRSAAIRQRLLVAEGDVLDTARVAESLRRLRRLRFLDDVSVIAERCADADGIVLTIATHDAWSMAPDVRLASAPPPGAQEEPVRGMRMPNGMLGLEERNFLGTGRELRAALETRYGEIGGSAQLTDPFVLGRPLFGRLRVARLPNENAYSAVLRSDDRYTDGAWRGQLALGRVSRWPMHGTEGGFVRSAYQGLAARRATRAEAASALFIAAGAELGDAHLNRFEGVRTPGPAAVARRFVGVDVGVDRIAATYAPNTTLLPRGAVYDVPQGFELSAVLGLGSERVTGAPAAHLDSWVGRVWQPRAGALVSTDVWSSGYLFGGALSGATLRAATSAFAPAAHGSWTARVAGERLVAPDPDVRALIGLDPTAPMLERRARLAGSAFAASVERAVRVDLPLARTTIDVAAFGAGSFRRTPCGTSEADVHAAAVGVGVRAVPLAAARTTMRLDLVVPVAGSPGVRMRPFATLTFAPGFGAERARDLIRAR